ncbi:hypothetical protein M404DRAFT_995573 [Pisolithus tinctorius Marx 270]|uniref:Uncharacterized protein n=1 Tax=Pisolithus tinctorius Marx 270 TaxID=870435 RepID=A0A0C3PPK3_PISTI|nr:hypothetical protein M404DRAFT_995573 [Pisolithus tinctorius Marx 270]
MDRSHASRLTIPSAHSLKALAIYHFWACNTLICAHARSSGKENTCCRELHLC